MRLIFSILCAAAFFFAVPNRVDGALTNSTYIICEGDSLTEGNGASPRLDSNYVMQAFGVLNPKYGVYLTNLGHSGDKLEDLSRDPTNMLHALTLRSNISTYAKVTLVLQGGGNDIYTPSTVTQITNWMHACITNYRAKFPNDFIILATSTHITGATTEITNKFYELANLIRANHYGVDAYVDWYGDPRLYDTTDNTYFDADEVHPNNAGCAVQAELIMPVLINNRRVQDDFFVRKDGSDSNTGYTNNSTGAKLTIQAALDLATFQDRISVNAGVYAEIPNIPAASGLVGHNLTLTNTGNVMIHGFTVRGKSNTIASARTDIWHLTCTNIAGDAALSLDYAGANNNTFRGIGITGSNSVIAGFELPITVGAKGILSGTLTTNNYFDDIRMTNCNDTFVTLAGRGHVLTNSTMTGSNGWDIIRPFGNDLIIVANTITNVQNPGDYNANHSDIFQVFGDDPATISTNVLIAGNRVLFAPNYQFGNITDDQEDGRIGRWTFQNNLLVDIASTMNLAAPDFHFYNNTFVRCGPVSSWAIIWSVSTAGYAHGIHIVNNVFERCGNTNSASSGWYGGDTITNYWLGYNFVRGDVAKTGYTPEAGSIKDVDPLLSSTTYKPATNSPVLNIGTNLLAYFTTDLEGVARDSTPTLGAFETGTYDGGVSPCINSRISTGFHINQSRSRR